MNKVPVHFGITDDNEVSIIFNPVSRTLEVTDGNERRPMAASEAACLIRFLSLALEKFPNRATQTCFDRMV